MQKRIQIERLDDFFIDLGKRKTRGVFFYRINGYNRQIHEFLLNYYEAARLSGVIIEGKLQNPDNNHLAYYNEIMGTAFQMDAGFVDRSLKKWLPRMSDSQRENVTGSICETLMGLRRAGKNDNILKNAYIKFMCWLYYKFERVVNHLGDEQLPKILYEGGVGFYELLLLNVLSTAGCDIVLLQYHGDGEYRKADPDASRSSELQLPGLAAFPETFSLKQIQRDIQKKVNDERLYGERSQYRNCTNAWMSGKVFEDVRKSAVSRGSEPGFYYNCFCRITGVEDKLTYQNELYQLQLEIKNGRRPIVIVNETIDPPSPEEIEAIQRKAYQNTSQLIMDLSGNLRGVSDQDLKRLMHQAFVDVLLEESEKEDCSISRLTNKAVYLLCWLNRYQQKLLAAGSFRRFPVSSLWGCRNDNEALFFRFLSRLPVDVLIFHPNLNQACCLEERSLYEVHYELSLSVPKYPEDNLELRVGTAAYQAERELDTLMYQDTGLYRNQQYVRANAISMQTMYEEISILWDQELKYRPNFSTVDDIVNMPVIFSKVSGVKDSVLPSYWSSIKSLITPDTVVIREVPHLTTTSPNPIKQYATEFFRNGRLQKTKIKAHKAYAYSF